MTACRVSFRNYVAHSKQFALSFTFLDFSYQLLVCLCYTYILLLKNVITMSVELYYYIQELQISILFKFSVSKKVIF